MTENNNLNFASKVVKRKSIIGLENAISTPIVASSTFTLENATHGALLSSLQDPGNSSPWLYTRWGNPTTDATGELINSLENGYKTFVTGSGMAAISTTILAIVRAGDHVIAPEPVYGGTHEIFEKILPLYGIEVSWVDGTDPKAYQKEIKENTVLIYGETPANPTMSIIDLEELANIAKVNNILTIVDSTFASPYNQNPINLGINIVVHSATKYLGGHSDIIAGSISIDSEDLAKKVFQMLKLLGGILSPFDSYLLTRGIKTLDVRMERHNKNGMVIAKFLKNHPKIEKVYYPGLEDHPQHEIAKKQMKGFGGMIAFEVKGGMEAGKLLIENLKLIILAVSLGGVESLIEQASTMTHTMVSREKRLESGISDGLIRLSVGLEATEDLIKDLEQALALI
jgi:methionine-gamma-lyase